MDYRLLQLLSHSGIPTKVIVVDGVFKIEGVGDGEDGKAAPPLAAPQERANLSSVSGVSNQPQMGPGSDGYPLPYPTRTFFLLTVPYPDFF